MTQHIVSRIHWPILGRAKRAWTWKQKPLSCVQLFATPWTITIQNHLSMDSPGKNTGVASHSLSKTIGVVVHIGKMERGQ